MNYIALQYKNSDDEEIPESKQCWHSVCIVNGSDSLVCTGEFLDSFGGGLYETKHKARGGITCKNCIKIIKEYKAIRL